MGLYSLAAEQREKETKALKSFLGFSLVGSLALHVGVLSFALSDLLFKAPEIEEDPLEVTLIDIPKPPEQKVEPKVQPKVVRTEGGANRVAVARPQPRAVAPAPQPKVQAPAPKPQPVQPSRSEIATEPKPVATPLPSPVAPLPSPVASPNPAPAPAPVATNPAPAAPVAPAPSPAQVPGNAGNADSNPGSSPTVATGPRTDRVGTPGGQGRGSGDREGRGSGRLACRDCSKPKYPEGARRRGVQGAAKVAVDVDDNGNVTNVRVARSSGDAELDEAAVRAARRWKFKTPNGARQGVMAKVDFELENTERARRAEERRKRRKEREARRRREQAEANRTPAPAAQPPQQQAAPNNQPLRRRLRQQLQQPAQPLPANPVPGGGQ